MRSKAYPIWSGRRLNKRPHQSDRETFLRTIMTCCSSAAVAVSHRPRRRAETKGDFVYPRRRLSRRGNETRSDRAHQRKCRACFSRGRGNFSENCFIDAGDQGTQGPIIRHCSMPQRPCQQDSRTRSSSFRMSRGVLPIVASIPVSVAKLLHRVERGCDVDKPRNLAKSVTVE